jgi:hypothetical protein
LFVRARTWESEHQNSTLKPLSGITDTGRFCADIVAAFVRSDALTLGELERLTKKLPFARGDSMPAELIRSAVADIFRPTELQEDIKNTGAANNRIPLLGGWVYEQPWTGSMPLDAWDVMHQLVLLPQFPAYQQYRLTLVSQSDRMCRLRSWYIASLCRSSSRTPIRIRRWIRRRGIPLGCGYSCISTGGRGTPVSTMAGRVFVARDYHAHTKCVVGGRQPQDETFRAEKV